MWWCVCQVVQGNQGCSRNFNRFRLKSIASKKTHRTCGAAARLVGLGDCRDRRGNRAPAGVEDEEEEGGVRSLGASPERVKRPENDDW